MRSRLLLLAAAVVLVALPAGPASAGWVIGGTGAAGARAAVLMPPTGLTVAGQSCTPTASPDTVTSTIAYRDGSSATGLGSVTAARPAAAVEGDLLLAFYVVQSGTAPTTPAGWTRVDAGSYSDVLTVALYRRTATAAEPSGWTWSSTVSRSAAVTIAAYSGVDTAVNIVPTGGGGIGTAITAPEITNPAASSRLVGAFSVRAQTIVTAPPGMTSRGSTTSTAGGTGTAAVSIGLADEPWPTATATGARTATAGTGGENIGALLALTPLVKDHEGTITYRGAATALGTSSVAVTSPAGVQAGDLLLVGLAKRGSATLTIGTPDGWTRLRSDDAGASAYRQTVFWRLATSADPAGTSYTFTSSTTDNAAVVLLVYRGVDQTKPVLTHSGQGASGKSVTAPPVTPGRTDARLVGIFGTRGTGSLSGTPTGMTIRAGTGNNGNNANNVGVALLDEPWPPDSDTGGRASANNQADFMVGQLVALKAHSVPQVSLAWTPSTSSYAEGYDLALTSGGSPVASDVLTPRTAASYETGTLTPGGSYQVAVTTRAQSWRSATADLDFTVTTQC